MIQILGPWQPRRTGPNGVKLIPALSFGTESAYINKWDDCMNIGDHWIRLCGIGLALSAVLLCAGCSTASRKYIPQTIGTTDAGDTIDGLTVSILPLNDRVILGNPLTFEVTIRNIGTSPIWIPRNPQVVLVWVYPNGRRDNVVQETPPSRHFNKHSAVLLHPGKSITKDLTIRTHYFPEPGITEFRAILRVTENTNSHLRPFWRGRALSNAYGVLVHQAHYRS